MQDGKLQRHGPKHWSLDKMCLSVMKRCSFCYNH